MDILVVAEHLLDPLKSIAGVGSDIKTAYDSMTPEQKTTFWQNVMLTAAAVGAKVA